jgi:16S rRNA (guanine1207-N2)-methyltransferase
MTSYYTFHRSIIEAHNHRLTIVGKPGVWSWDGLNPGTAALLEVAEIEPEDTVLDLGCGTGVIGAVASLQASQGLITLVDCNVTATTCAKRTLADNNISNAEVKLTDGVTGLRPTSYDLVLSHLPRGRAVQEELIHSVAWVLRPGGRFYFVAHKRAGVKGAIAYTRTLFGRCGVVRQKKGYHVALTVKPAELRLDHPKNGYATRTITLDGTDTTLVGKPGVFAWDRLDDGTAALLDVMEVESDDTVLDLGCGTGLAGLSCARQASRGQVVLVDADVRAVESARRTLEANGTANGEVLVSDCGSGVLDRHFDLVVTNPPFHQGVGIDYQVAHQFVCDAAHVLRLGGRLFLVANRFLRYSDLIREAFGDVAVAYADNRYHVLTAVARKAGSR